MLWLAIAGLGIAMPFVAQGVSTTPSNQSGGKVSAEVTAKRIVTIPMPAASMLISVAQGVNDLVAMNPESRTAMRAGILGQLFPAALTVPTDVTGRGFRPNVEAILAVHPDLVIQWGDRGSDLITPLKAAGLRVVGIKYGTEQDVRDWLSLFGDVTDHRAHAEWLIAARRRMLHRLAGLQALPDAKKPRVLYLYRAISDLQVAGKGTYQAFNIKVAGGRNAAVGIQGFKPVDREQIIAWNPDVILLNNFEPGLTPARITNDPVLRLTTASRNKRVYNIPIGGYRWDPPSQDSPISWLWLAQLLHPQRLHIDLRSEISTYLSHVYGKPVRPERVSRILRPGTGPAADWQRN